ncbi:MAG: Mpv17/PMP22 family protein [Planctomycetota bacterium]
MTRHPTVSPPAATPRDGRPPPWRSGLDAARANAVPGLVLSGFAVGLLLSYWRVAPVTAALDAVAAWRGRLADAGVGWVFAAVGTALFGGVIPWVVQKLRPSMRGQTPWSHLGYLCAFWAVKGVEIDFLYRAQAAVFGGGHDPGTIAVKVVFDMGVYCPLWAVPGTVAVYAFKDRGFSFAGVSLRKFRGWYRDDVVPVVLSNWAVWVPAVCVIYALPLALQLPVQNLVLCFWSLLLVWQVRASRA